MSTPPTPTTPTTPSPTTPAAAKGEEKNRYKATLNLPQTSFPMKASLVQNEPASLKRWDKLGLYKKVRESRAGKPKFVFHDGPPYANGSIHLGHLMNKVLKDFVVRSKTMQELDCAYIPGWDCHGLPIEHKVMTELVETKKIDKLLTLTEDQRRMAVRRECQKYAEKFHKLHTTQMTRLLTLADYENPYLTMKPEYEAGVLEVLAGLLDAGLVYRALKPVHWSIANETALAEAELEYMDREDLSVYVDFEAADAEAVYDAFGMPKASDDEGDDDGAEDESKATRPAPGVRPNQRPSFTIWTTTPWTLPANLAIAVNPDFDYALVFVDGNITVMAKDLVEKVTQNARSEEVTVLATAPGKKLVGLKYRHPFVDLARGESVAHAPAGSAPKSLDKVFTVMAADYVTLDDGTGLVHTAPGHGQEDYQTGLREGLPVYCPVLHDGKYDASVPQWLRGLDIWTANQKVADHLKNSGHLFYSHKFMHSYPHDWRSKTPVIFRCTEQWFVSVEKRGSATAPGFMNERSLRDAALLSTAQDVAFVPEWGRNRMRGMLESRPDWCISRQRAWGLPIPSFILPTGQSVMTGAMVRAVSAVVRAKGSDAWFQLAPAELLEQYDETKDAELPAQLRPALTLGARQGLKKGNDILDVWFESGSSWNAVMRHRGLGYPVDLYLEGSDQHRGWFQLSLLPALGVTGVPPFKTLLTHGFMVDKDGRKLSKSSGDTVEDLFNDFGVDVLRWWVSSLAYENDVKVDRDFFNAAGESYRKIRNTLRFMLSNLADFTPTCDGPNGNQAGHCVDLKSIPTTSIDAWVLGEFQTLAKEVVDAFNRYDFRTAHLKLYDFCNDTLSAVYLAAVKDRLYCDAKDSKRRRQTQTVLWDLTDGLCRLLAPILCHTADEAYRALWSTAAKPAGDDVCVHLKPFITDLGVKPDADWAKVVTARAGAMLAMEKARAELGVDNPLDMGVALPDPDGSLAKFDAHDLADLMGVSRVSADKGASAAKITDLRNEPRCERSWKRDGTVKQRSDGGMLSDRDALAVGLG
jgi:isoleucyl-tRNA synthetase